VHSTDTDNYIYISSFYIKDLHQRLYICMSQSIEERKDEEDEDEKHTDEEEEASDFNYSVYSELEFEESANPIQSQSKRRNIDISGSLFNSLQKKSGDNCQSVARCNSIFFHNKISTMQGKFNCYYFDNG